MLTGNPFAPDSASDWWNFAANVFIGLVTLLALIVAIRDSVLANRRARAAEEQTAYARAAEAAAQHTLATRAERSLRNELQQVLADQEKNRYWLQVAESYGDALRIGQIEATLAGLAMREAEIREDLYEEGGETS
ncbi:hypothetical protein [Herbiconiux flava]|uniref:Uncharacterized protein n=1 Tax=Herbiconiux flava TaxID=881268 RepID=A0A852SNP9_9MICO|nr:hypothetical protein [Herbiconiux flava]NYD70435.1 hypothetical protein [Herbiconiux flava]GLK17190.1 hypothetical protein GCM10017602_16720 [Herbiconiux flava]